jgi:hypothetical protein
VNIYGLLVAQGQPAVGGEQRDERETIGRLPHLLTHIAAQLPSLADGDDSFEAIRVRYGRTQSSLAARGIARVTAPRAGIRVADRYWSSTRDLIKELQTLGWVAPGPVPSRSTAVDTHRERRYALTSEGKRVARIASSRRSVADELTAAALARHPYLRALLEELASGPLFCPEIGEGQVARNPSRRHWAEWGATLLERSDPHVRLSPDQLDAHLATAIRRRFGRRRAEGLRPTAREIAHALSDAFADAALESRGLRFGVTTLDALCSWGMELLLLDQSRYVPGHEGGNLIWICSDLERDPDGRLRARRRIISDQSERVARALTETYFQLRADSDAASATEDGERRGGAYQLIHVVRAAAAFRTKTTRELGNRVLEMLASGQLDLGVRVRLMAARYEVPPRSEPMYARGGTRALILTMTMSSAHGESVTAGDNHSLKEE